MGNSLKRLFKQLAGAVLVTPVADVSHVEFSGLKCEDLFYVFDVFGTAASFSPTQFLNNDILGGGQPDGMALEINLLPALESLLIVGVIGQEKEFNFESGGWVGDDVAGGHRHGFE